MTEPLDLLWGGDAVAEVLGVSKGRAYAMLEKGEIPDARKLNGRWVISRKKLIAMFEGEAA